jgi:hypothetical protein
MLMSMRRDIKATAQHLLTVSFAIADTSTGSNFCLVNCVPLASLLYCDDRKNNDRHLFVDVDPMNSNHWIWGILVRGLIVDRRDRFFPASLKASEPQGKGRRGNDKRVQ